MHKKKAQAARDLVELKKGVQLTTIETDLKQKATDIEPFKVQVGRFDLELRRKDYKKKFKDFPPPGSYNPKMQLAHVPGYIYHTPSTARPASAASGWRTNTENLSKEDKDFNPDKVHMKIHGSISMNKTINRKPINEKVDDVDPDGNRYLYRDTPTVSSNYRPVSSFSMKKAAKRRGFYDEKEDLPDYKPNYEFVQRRISSAVPRFDLTTGRKNLGKMPATANEKLYDYDYYTKEHDSHVYQK